MSCFNKGSYYKDDQKSLKRRQNLMKKSGDSDVFKNLEKEY